MFNHSLMHTSLMLLTAFGVMLAQSSGLFAFELVCWSMFWFVELFFWLLIVDEPSAVIPLYLLLVPAMVVAHNLKFQKRKILLTCLGCGLLAYSISIFSFISIYRQHQRLLAKYPPVDLKPRLAYERSPGTGIVREASRPLQKEDPLAVDTPRFNPDALARQSAAFEESSFYDHYWNGEHGVRSEYRQRAFEALSHVHEGFVADFVAQPGLGKGRMPGLRSLSEYDFALDDRESRPDEPPPLLDQPVVTDETESSSNPPQGDQVANPAADIHVAAMNEPVNPPSPQLLQDHHRDNVVLFAPRTSFGGVNKDLQARGFQPHGFRLLPENEESAEKMRDWRLARVELISILKHQPAAVYVSEHLPAMDELRDAPTRATTAFESNAVAKLRLGEELVTESMEHALRMVGAIRALSQCRKCHQVAEGALLGAFSYQFKRPQAPAKPTKPLASL